MTTGARTPAARMRRSTSSPSIPGRPKSRRTISCSPKAAASAPSAPSRTQSTDTPSRPRLRRRPRPIIGSSSINNIRNAFSRVDYIWRFGKPATSSETKSMVYSIGLFAEAITDPRFGLDDRRRVGIVLYFRAQLPDKDPEILRILLMRRTPDGGQDLPMGHHAAGVSREHAEHLVFARRQLDRRAVLDD